ncbi:MAG: hypothetical protein KAR42_14055 [candidate division Zixibacteria bacterium]|nr:hypothetical protein [candidate division Zixibacteria bacterium]
MIKSPVDEIVDGIDAIGSILDENLPTMKSRIENLIDKQIDVSQSIAEVKRAITSSDEIQHELKKTSVRTDNRISEIHDTIEALTRRMDQLQKSLLDMMMLMENKGGSVVNGELSDTVKVLEDRLRKLEGNRLIDDNFKTRL